MSVKNTTDNNNYNLTDNVMITKQVAVYDTVRRCNSKKLQIFELTMRNYGGNGGVRYRGMTFYFRNILLVVAICMCMRNVIS